MDTEAAMLVATLLKGTTCVHPIGIKLNQISEQI